jgi:hypothetical protein
MANMVGFEQITVSTSALSPTVATVTGRAKMAVFLVVSEPLRWRSDGTAPTASAGFPIKADGHVVVVGHSNIINSSFIRSGGTDATLECIYYDNVDIVDIKPV